MKAFLYIRLVRVANAVQARLLGRAWFSRLLLVDRLSGLRWRMGSWRALVNAEEAYRRVPAYRDFVDERGGPPARRYRGGLPDLSAIPEIDKASYVQCYGHEARCLDGRLPGYGVAVDESSGSSGRATSWVRGPAERAATKHMLQLSFRSAVGDQSYFVINAFALGAWATGLNVTASLGDVCILKSTGPDIDKIVHTLEEFGPGYDYVVLGYPPFLKTLADDPRVDWSAYRVRAVFGGEGISEPLRTYLLRSFTAVLGSYGASDLEINMAAETPFTVALRRELQTNEALRRRLTDSRHATLPMVFQYNPLAYYFETNALGELIATVTSPANIAPKIRYNIHDLGHVARFETAVGALRDCGLAHLVSEADPLRLPLLFLYGRSDQSIDYYGANVTPESVREILFSLEDLVPVLSSFRLIAAEGEQHDTTMEVALELVEGRAAAAVDADVVAERLFPRLAAVNGDFRNAYRHTATSDQLPRVTVYPHGTGPFAGADRIKNQYVGTASPYDQLQPAAIR